MEENSGNRVVVVDTEGNVTRIKTESEIVKENEELEKALKEKKVKPRKVRTEESMPVILAEQPDRSVNLGVVGVGQCGSKIAEEFYNKEYNVVAINTATQDLKCINIPEKQKLFLNYALGGTAKELSLGEAAAVEYSDTILEVLKENFSDSDVLLLATAGGGGTGSGSAETMIKLMTQLGKPVVALYVLPLATEDVLAKHNAIMTLSKLAQMAKEDVISSLTIIDNSKIEMIKPGLSMSEFWKFANNVIVEPLDLFNKLSVASSQYISLDPMDFSAVFLGGDCSLYGMIEIDDYMEESKVAEAMLNNLKNGLLASDFDLAQTRSAGIIITGSAEVLQNIPAANLEYGFAMISKVCNGSVKIYRGVYEVPDKSNKLRIYSFFSGLGLPEARVSEMKSEAEKYMEALKTKEDNRATAMKIDIGKTQTASAVDTMYKKVTNKNSALGKLTQNSHKVIDKRRR